MKPLRLSWLAIVAAVVVMNPDNAAARYEAGVKGKDVKGGGHGGNCRHRHKHHPDDRYWKKGGSSGSGGSGGVGGAGEPWYMADDSHEAKDLERDRKFREKTRSSEKQAPLVCFLRGDGLRHGGVMRFPMGTIPKDKCTHIVYSYLETDNKTGDVLFRKRGLHKEKVMLRRLASMKNHNRHLKVLYSYGGGAHWSSLLNRLRSDKDMEQLVDKLDEVLREMRLDGINFHLEGPGPSTCSKNDADRVLQFIMRLRLKVAHHDVLLTMQLPACRDSKCDHVQKDKLARYVDYFFLMTFDYKLDDLSRTRITSGVLQYENGRRTHIDTEGCVHHWVQAGLHKNQIIPGIPTYGRSYTLDNPNKNGVDESLKKSHPLGYGANFTKTDGYMNYIETCRRVMYFHWRRQWVSSAATPYIHYQDQWVSYEDIDSVKYKIEWMRKNKLGGIFLWSLDADDYAGSCQQGIRYPLVEAARKALQGYRPS